MYYANQWEDLLLMTSCVDDILISLKNQEAIEKAKLDLSKHFECFEITDQCLKSRVLQI